VRGVLGDAAPQPGVPRAVTRAEADFYADHKSDTVTTARHGRGHGLDGWRSNSAVRVTTWYDQSGRAAHAAQPIPDLQPYLDTSSGLLVSATPDSVALGTTGALADAGAHLVVPASVTSALLGGLDATAVFRARAPAAEVSLHDYDDGDPG
jgi:hypothetical protein